MCAGEFGRGDTASAALPSQTSLRLAVAKCRQVESGDTFAVDIKVADVENLMAWEIFFAYDRHRLEVLEVDVRQMLDKNEGSSVFPGLSDPLPNGTGLYRLAAADVGSAEGESGDGVLARLTLLAKEAGASPASIYRADYNDDGVADIGPTLTARGGKHLGDTNGDRIFDGPINSGQIAVDGQCVQPAPTPDDVPDPNRPTPRTAGPGSTGNPNQSSTPVPAGDPTPTPPSGVVAITNPPSRTPRDHLDPFGRPPLPRSGGSDLSTWLIALVAGSLALTGGATYIVFRTSQRPS